MISGGKRGVEERALETCKTEHGKVRSGCALGEVSDNSSWVSGAIRARKPSASDDSKLALTHVLAVHTQRRNITNVDSLPGSAMPWWDMDGPMQRLRADPWKR